MARRVTFAAAFVAALVLASPAHAATLTNSGGTLRFVAGAGKANVLSIDEMLGAVMVTRRPEAGDADPYSSVSGCTAMGAAYQCNGIQRIVIDAGNGNDVIDANGAVLGGTGVASLPMTLTGGDGGDQLYAGGGNDTITGGPDADAIYAGSGNDSLDGGDANDALDGEAGNDSINGAGGADDLAGSTGNDVLRGGDGDDALDGGPGADTIGGGNGTDRADVSAVTATPPALSVTLNGLADDGAAQEGDNVLPDVEAIAASARTLLVVPGTVSLTGDGNPNTLTARLGRATIDGGAGPDTLTGGPQADTLLARDGFPDTVNCGGGHDIAVADPLDTVAEDCEDVQVADAATPPVLAGPDDLPPKIGFTVKRTLSPDRPTKLTATASDDRGVALVRFIDDGRIICADRSAPFTCAYRPRGADVGRDTLIVIAQDAAGQTTTAIRAITVRRFTPRLTLTVKGLRASGRLKLPARVTRAQGCKGRVTISSPQGSRRTRIRRNCTYSSLLAGAIRARFGGNSVLKGGSKRLSG